MTDKKHINIDPLGGVAALVARVGEADFGKTALAFVNTAARVNNLGAFYIPDLSRPNPVLSVWSGPIGDYWFQRNADYLLNDPEIRAQISSLIASAPQDGLHIERWHPDDGDPRKPIFDRDKIIERVGVTSRRGRAGYQSFYLRSFADGWFSDHEYESLRACLPVVHELIGVRHKLIGSRNFRHHMGAGASALRERNVAQFADLSPREAQTCDLVLQGRSVAATALEMGVSETTVRTLRRRAFRKLGVSGSSELMAMFVNREYLS